MTKSVTKRILEKRGIKDGSSYLEEHESDAKLGYADKPGIDVKGSIHLIMRRFITRDEIDQRYKKLKHL